ncbi:hypothetical protein HPB47_022153 [Ixodes persulcatus]|uniref:Uncharacterized protein n=1 Tax=Ixodes persulcatus TaxID=34615 RepID=A0AC60QAT8_IXOPE|nr:hypothetical protein HPB47_022153 [Ixodes persulcatus]
MAYLGQSRVTMGSLLLVHCGRDFSYLGGSRIATQCHTDQLGKWLNDITELNWDRHIPEIAFAMRTAESVATGYSSVFLCYKRELRTVWEPRQDAQGPKPPESADKHLQQSSPDACRRRLTSPEATKSKPKKHRRRTTTNSEGRQHVKVGDLVLRDAHTMSNASKGISAKLAARREGPIRVVDQVGDNDFLLSNPASGRRRGIAQADQLALYHGPWEDRSPTASRLKRVRTVRRGQRHGPSGKV